MISTAKHCIFCDRVWHFLRCGRISITDTYWWSIRPNLKQETDHHLFSGINFWLFYVFSVCWHSSANLKIVSTIQTSVKIQLKSASIKNDERESVWPRNSFLRVTRGSQYSTAFYSIAYWWALHVKSVAYCSTMMILWQMVMQKRSEIMQHLRKVNSTAWNSMSYRKL